jgi:hypothetical protein
VREDKCRRIELFLKKISGRVGYATDVKCMGQTGRGTTPEVRAARRTQQRPPRSSSYVPGALRLLRAYGQLYDGKMRRSIAELVENIAAGRC